MSLRVDYAPEMSALIDPKDQGMHVEISLGGDYVVRGELREAKIADGEGQIHDGNGSDEATFTVHCFYEDRHNVSRSANMYATRDESVAAQKFIEAELSAVASGQSGNG